MSNHSSHVSTSGKYKQNILLHLASFSKHLRLTVVYTSIKDVASVPCIYFFSLFLCIPSVLVNPKFSKKISMFGFVRKSDTQTQSQHTGEKCRFSWKFESQSLIIFPKELYYIHTIKKIWTDTTPHTSFAILGI